MRRLVSLAVATLFVMSLFTPLAMAGTTTPTSTDDVEIDSALENETGVVEVIVQVEDLHLFGAYSTDKVEELQRTADASQDEVREFAQTTDGVTFKKGFWITNAVLLEVDTTKVSVDEIADLNTVETIEKNRRVSVSTPSSTASTSPQSTEDVVWNVDNIDAPQVWEKYNTRGEGVKVAVLDTGVEHDHPDIDLYTRNESDPTYPGGWAEFDGDGNQVQGSEPHDSQTGTAQDYHGTHTSGTVAGGNSTGPYIGVAPGVDLMHGLVLPDGSGNLAQVIGGMQWAVEENADVISMSLGRRNFHSAYLDATQNAHDAGTIVVAAVGNSGEGTSNAPGSQYDVISVGSHDANDEVSSFSAGKELDQSELPEEQANWPNQYIAPKITAPGENVRSAVGDGNDVGPRWNKDGTSMATPHVSGAIALLLSEYDLTKDEIEAALYNTAEKPESSHVDTRYGHGMLNLSAAMEYAASPTTVTGTVSYTNGTPVMDTWVAATQDNRAKTDSNGEFAMQVTDGETYALTFDAGAKYETDTTETTVDGDTALDLTATEKLNIDNVEHTSQVVQHNAFDLVFDMDYVEEVTITPNKTSDLVVDGQEVEAGETVTYDEAIDGEHYTVSVTPREAGPLSVDYEFVHGNETVRGTTDPVSVENSTIDLEGDGVYVRSVIVDNLVVNVDETVSDTTGIFTGDIPAKGDIRVEADDAINVTLSPNGTYERMDLYEEGTLYDQYNPPFTIDGMETNTSYTFEFTSPTNTSNESKSGIPLPTSDEKGSTPYLVGCVALLAVGMVGWQRNWI